MSLPAPLEGVRILDFTWVRSGPWAARWLGAFGAEVIKVQWPANLGIGGAPRAAGHGERAPDPNETSGFIDCNINKLSITINVRSPRGLELTKRLLAKSDVVIENFRAGVMERWGLAFEDMKQIKPDIIYVSMAGFGHTGPQVPYAIVGQSTQALSGLNFLSGFPDKPPAGWGYSYMDDMAGMYATMCALTALRHRNATGQGQYVDLAQMIAGITLTGPAFLDRSVNGRANRREGYPPGNLSVWPGTPLVNNYRGRTVAPHNAYRTKPGGYNDWCAIACYSDEEWQNLVRTMGSPAWAADGKFASLQGRIKHQEEMDQGIEGWTQTMEKYELTELCQAAGVGAMPVQSSQDRVEHDPQLRARDMYPEAEQGVFGLRKHQSTPFRLSKSSVTEHKPAPLLGEHTVEVMERVLGLSREEIAAGYEDGTFWPENTPKPAHTEEALR